MEILYWDKGVLQFFFFEKVDFLSKYIILAVSWLPTLRVRRPETRLTVYWALQYQSGSKFQSKRAATFGKNTLFVASNVLNYYSRCPYVYAI